MSAESSRFARQVCLPEIGREGQLRIEASALLLGSHLDELGSDVARRYARGAGISRVIEVQAVASPEALGHFRHEQSRSVAAGALAALAAMSEALTP